MQVNGICLVWNMLGREGGVSMHSSSSFYPLLFLGTIMPLDGNHAGSGLVVAPLNSVRTKIFIPFQYAETIEYVHDNSFGI